MASFSQNQQKFIGTYSKLTGLHPGVVSAQLAAEEPVGAHSGYHGTQDWLNIGITDSGPMGAGNPAWRDPVQAAKLSAAWVAGKTSIPGFGSAAPGIRAILSTAGQSPQAQISAIQRSGWASSGYHNLGSLYGTYGSNNPSAGSFATIPQAPAAGGGTRQVTTQKFDQAGYDAARRSYLIGTLAKQTNPFDVGPKVATGANPLFTSGLLTTKMPDVRDYVSAQQELQKVAGGTQLTDHPAVAGQGRDVNPLAHGWTLTETDQGVDATAKPGTPILAMNDSRVVNVDPAWYKGQPFVQMQILNGPNKGKFWYVSEQITGYHPVGTVIRQGQPVARFAPTGTGIEIGWGSGRQGQTLTQARTPQLVAGRHAVGTPQGIDFSKRVLGRAPVSIG